MNLPNATDFEVPLGSPGDWASPLGEATPDANRSGAVKALAGGLEP
jgi:hypothetical protein